MHVIVYRERPDRPWIFVTYNSSSLESAEQSARWLEEQERRVFKHSQAEAKVITEEQFDSGQKIRGRRSRARPPVPAKLPAPLPKPVVVSEAPKKPASIDEIKAMLEG